MILAHLTTELLGAFIGGITGATTMYWWTQRTGRKIT